MAHLGIHVHVHVYVPLIFPIQYRNNSSGAMGIHYCVLRVTWLVELLASHALSTVYVHVVDLIMRHLNDASKLHAEKPQFCDIRPS